MSISLITTDRLIKVGSHTDNVPIGAGLVEKFTSNGELSTALATTIVRYLQKRGVQPGFLSSEGYAEFRPVAPNVTLRASLQTAGSKSCCCHGREQIVTLLL